MSELEIETERLMREKKKIAVDLQKSMFFDDKDCRNIIIDCGSLCTSPLAYDMIKEALNLYAKLPRERIEDFLK